MKNKNLIASGWGDYEILDSGDNRKLERYGAHTIIRPETQAIWSPRRPEEWKQAAAEFRSKDGKGVWTKNNLPESWQMTWGDVHFEVRLTSFKHTGIFPEQSPNWKWVGERVKELGNPNVLNLFGYTGIASIVAAQAGAKVTHVDASKQANAWSKENALLSGLEENSIRYILEDALKFAEREVRRGAKYEGIILDPPAFGRGVKGEVWKIEESLPRLLSTVKSLLAEKRGSFVLLNGYAAGYSPHSFAQAAEGVFGETEGEYGELAFEESGSERLIPSGIYVRFSV